MARSHRWPGGGIARRLGLERNTLRRSSDRVESSIAVTLLLAFLLGGPLLGLLVGWSSYDSALRVERAYALRHSVTARLTADAPAPTGFLYGTSQTTVAVARWTYGGAAHTGKVLVPPAAKAGTKVAIWVDGRGRPVKQPPTRIEMTMRAVVMGTFAASGLGFVLWFARLLVRRVLIQRHLADWEADWAAFGPRWTGRTDA